MLVPSRFLRNAPLASYEPELLITPHPAAPRFSQADSSQVLKELLTALGSPTASNNETFALLREACYVNLFVFLKYVAGYSGPYDKLNWNLHADLCNYRQSLMEPGIKAAAFLPRTSLKSTIMSHGGGAWELLRNPDLRLGIFSSKYERAAEFLHIAQRTFDDNELFAELFPEYVPTGGYGSRWNDSEGVLPCRSRNFPEPNLKAHSAGGSTAGIHVDLAIFDDIIDDSQLNSDHGATADLYRMKNWLFTNMRTLLIDQSSRVVLSATRYAIDDPYEDIIKDASGHFGYWDEIEKIYPLAPKGEWDVYYRLALEDGVSILPEAYTVEMLDKIAVSDPWTYQTQYLNNPHSAGVLEFVSMRPNVCILGYDHVKDGFFVERPYEKDAIPLASCDLIFALDPAGSKKKISEKTSQTSLVVLATDWEDNCYFLEASKGYWATSVYIDKLFELRERYQATQRASFVEMQGGFKILEDVIREEERRRELYLNLRVITATENKDDTIRGIWEPLLKLGKVYLNEGACLPLEKEIVLFPSVKGKDLLDAGKIALHNRVKGTRPENWEGDPELIEARRLRHRRLRRSLANNITGY